MTGFIDKEDLIDVLKDKQIPDEIDLSLWEDEYHIWIAICLVYGFKLGEQEYIHINKVLKEDFYEHHEEYKRKTYQVKNWVKRKFPSIKISSKFNWK
ncbi:MAG: hypothetical protein PHY47_09570 [Lachnospiraceae bacterium]|nr:hypothetical protein [Lachnospiraceae bacterium]